MVRAISPCRLGQKRRETSLSPRTTVTVTRLFVTRAQLARSIGEDWSARREPSALKPGLRSRADGLRTAPGRAGAAARQALDQPETPRRLWACREGAPVPSQGRRIMGGLRDCAGPGKRTPRRGVVLGYAPKMTRSITIALEDLGLEDLGLERVCLPGSKRYSVSEQVDVVPLAALAESGQLFGAD